MSKNTVHSVPRKEDDLREPVQKMFPSEQYAMGTEVPFGQKRIDLVFKSLTGVTHLVTVELKIKDWRRAVWQAVHNRQVAEYSYVAIPEQNSSTVDVDLLNELCLGLIVVDPSSARIVVQAKRSRYVNERLAHAVADYLEVKSNV